MINFIQNFMDLFKISEEKKENEDEVKIGDKQRLDALHKQAKTQLKKKKPVSYTF
jgi:hypothetical protein